LLNEEEHAIDVVEPKPEVIAEYPVLEEP